MSNVTHRLNEFLKGKELTVYAFERAIGVTQNVIQRAIKNDTSFNTSVLEKIAAKYHELNMNWLLIGDGEMLKVSQAAISNEPPIDYKTDRDLEKQLLQVQQDLINCMKQNAELKESSTGIRRTSATQLNK